MTDVSASLEPVDRLTVDVLTDNVSDNYVSKTLFAVSEFTNVVRAGAQTISGEVLLCGNLGYGLRLVSKAGGVRHVLLFDTGPESSICLRNCANLGIPMGEIECIAVSHYIGTTWRRYQRRSVRSCRPEAARRFMSIRTCSTSAASG